MKYSIDRLQTIVIGRRLDGGVDEVEFDCSRWLERYPKLTYYRVETTNPAGIVYLPERVEMKDGRLIWTIMPSDTAIEGEGRYQIVATGKNGERRTSANCTVIIKNIMPGTADGTPPEASKPWVEQVIEAAKRAEDAALKAEETVSDEKLDEKLAGKLNANQYAENAGKLMYVSEDGTLIPVALGVEVMVDESGNATLGLKEREINERNETIHQ